MAEVLRVLFAILALVFYLLAVNAFTYLVFATDKHCAETGQRRIPEAMLLFLATIGGTGGAIAGQKIYRHKTRKQPFCSQLDRIADIQIGLLALFSVIAIAAMNWA